MSNMHVPSTLAAALFSLIVLVPSCGNKTPINNLQAAWNAQNNPLEFLGAMDARFSNLPLSRTLSHKPWGGWSWKSYDGGIAYRWQTKQRAWNYTPPNIEKLKTMSTEEIRTLSPAEKFDILAEKYDYPTYNSEKNRHSPSALRWEGICHGWAISSLLLKEPEVVTLENRDGISIPFGSADTKAILSYYLGDILRGQIAKVGERCQANSSSTPECTDINAGSFHIILTNQLGLRGDGLVIESEPGIVVWNRPAYRYNTKITGRKNGASAGAAFGTTEEITVTTTVGFGRRSDPTWSAQGSLPEETEEYRYRLEIDTHGRVVGGAWISTRHPDFVWMRDDNVFTSQAPSQLEKLYRASVGELNPNPDFTPSPDPIADTSLSCPSSFELKNVPATGGWYCDKNGRVLGPFPRRMQELCMLTGGATCNALHWDESVFLQLRGTAECPNGTEMDPSLELCADNEYAFGPFTIQQVMRCKSLLPDSECDIMRLDFTTAIRVTM